MKLFGSTGHSRQSDKGRAAPGKRRWPKIVLIVVIVIAALLLGGYAAFELWSRPPETHIYTPAPEESPDAAETDSPEATSEPTAEPTQHPEGGYANENRYTFLIVGKEPSGDNTDTILVGTFDVEEKWLHIVSIPRDTLVNVPWSTKKINSVYGVSKSGDYSDWDYEDGIDGLRKALGDLMGYEPAYWAVVDIEAFQHLVDAIGGVTFDVPCRMYKPSLGLDLQAGEQLLSGEEALKVVRYRDYPMGDIDRISVQQDFLATLASQMLTLGNIPNIGKVLDIYDEYVDTNLASGNIVWFIRQFLSLSSEDITFQTLPGNYSVTINGLSYVSTDVDAWLEIVNNDLSPLNTAITKDDVDILTYTDGYGYSSTSGVIR